MSANCPPAGRHSTLTALGRVATPAAVMLLNKLAAVFAQRKATSSPIYESVDSVRGRRVDELDGTSLHSADASVREADAMSRVDSGHETLVDDDSPTPTFEGADLNSTLPEQHIYEEVRNRSSGPPARLPHISGVLHNKGPVIRPVACRPTPTHTPSATPSVTPTMFGSIDRSSVRRSHHYGSALELKTAQPAAGGRRSASSMAYSRYDSLDSLRPAAGEPRSCTSALIDEYRAYRAAVRPVEPRRDSTGGRCDSRRRGLARCDSLRSLADSTAAADARLGGSVSNLASAEPPARVGRARTPASLQSTPSPSDSGVVELGASLGERDSESGVLRHTVEQTEQVYSEKERTWEKELRKIQAVYDNRLKASQQRALKMEQMLTMQTYQLQQEKRKLRQELDETRRDKEQTARQNEQLRQELTTLRSQLEETEWRLCQKTGEISLLKSQLKDSQGDQTTRGHQMLHIRSQVRECVGQLDVKQAENKRLQLELTALRSQARELRADETGAVIGQLQRELERLKTELNVTRAQSLTQKENFEEERLHWLDEKQKVVNYQKQLQLNYMDMYKRNKSLEASLALREKKLHSCTDNKKLHSAGGNKLNTNGDAKLNTSGDAKLNSSGESQC